MATTTPPAISGLPAAPDPNDRSTFNTRAYPWSAALPTLSAEISAVAANVKANADDAAASSTAAAAQALAAAAQALAAASSAAVAGAVAWVSGTTYSVGDARYSPINLQTYRRIVAGAGTTDPSLDATNWSFQATVLVETVFTLTGTTPVLSVANGTIQQWTLTANSAPTSALASGQSLTLMVGDGAGYAITWPAVVWSGGVAPTLVTSGYTLVTLWQVGPVLYGVRAGSVA